MKNEILVISNKTDSAWLQTVRNAARALGQLQIVSEQTASTQCATLHCDLILLDATEIAGDLATLVSRLHTLRPDVPIIVATTSPTWERARKMFRAGASDYIRKSLDASSFQKSIKNVLEM